MVLADADEPLAVEQRGYVQRIRAGLSAPDKLRIYAEALVRVLPTIAPLQEALREAGRRDPECAAGWTPQEHGQHLVDLWTRTLLDPTAPPGGE